MAKCCLTQILLRALTLERRPPREAGRMTGLVRPAASGDS